MISPSKDIFIELKKTGSKERRILKEIITLLKEFENSKGEEKNMISSELTSLKKRIEEYIKEYTRKLESLKLIKKLEKKSSLELTKQEKKQKERKSLPLEREIIKRFGKKERKDAFRKSNKPRVYVEFANRLFFRFSERLIQKYHLKNLKKNLVKANMQFIPENYVSVIILTTIITIFVGFFISLFLILFDVSLRFPFISFTKESLLIRIAKYSWIFFVLPTATGLLLYFYPSLERKSIASKIDQELPFATIHMAAICEAILNPKRIFQILIKTGEYEELRKEFTKLLNEINLHGMNLVAALRNSAIKSPSSNLTDLFNGLATTITSGGELKEFFEKRSQTLLFEHKIEREKSTKVAETFMDIYISIVIAAPMIFMLLLMIMNISGIGLNLTPNAISLIIILGVIVVNIIFLMFMQLKQPSEQ